MRIQGVNTFVCLYALTALAYLSHEFLTDHGRTTTTVLVVFTVAAAFIFNMIHSQQLTLMPKFLFKNDVDSPAGLTERFRKVFWRTAAGLTDGAIVERIERDAAVGFMSIRSVRARSGDVDRIADCLLSEFRYVFAHIFGTEDASKLRQAVVYMMTSAAGLGPLGHMHFYMIEHEDEVVGFFKAETRRDCWIYRAAAAASSAYRIVRLFGLTRSSRIYERFKRFAAAQPPPTHREVRLTYLMIFPEHRARGAGSATLRMLINALREKTNDIDMKKLTLFVREKNPAARLFKSAGFVPAKRPRSADPLAADEAVGPALCLEYTL
jgi:ribosomal protein S18 acetylase RimI-like enzyme